MRRIDVFLCENNYARSRTEAKSLIVEGAVSVNGLVVKKPSFDVDEDSVISVNNSSKRYVSRGGLKLEGAFAEFDFNVEGKNCIDIGASTGGFTDCLLKHGAARVAAVDSGSSQLSPELICDSRVISIENYNARYMKVDDLPFVPSVAVMDVSFISATYIIPSIYETLAKNSDFICLIKPQFEVGKSNIGKGGIVKSEKIRQLALEKVVDFARLQGFEFIKSIISPIAGGDGNLEYLAHFKKI